MHVAIKSTDPKVRTAGLKPVSATHYLCNVRQIHYLPEVCLLIFQMGKLVLEGDYEYQMVCIVFYY